MKAVNDTYKTKCAYLESELQKAFESVNRLQADVEDRNKQIDELFSTRGGKLPSTKELEIQQLKEDNKRLLGMLKQTAEFKEFAGVVEDSGGNVRYASRKSAPASSGENCPIKIEDQPTQENDGEWVPDPAFQLAHQFRQKHGNELTFDLVNSLLSDLNKIWKEREKKQISRIKSQARDELNVLKRQLSYRTPYDQVVQKKTVAHIKHQMNKAQSKPPVAKDVPAGMELVDNTLQLVTQM